MLSPPIAAAAVQAAADGMALEEVPVSLLQPQDRPLCNGCANYIPDLHRHCPTCEWELCQVCCTQQRTGAVAAQGAAAGDEAPKGCQPGSSSGGGGAEAAAAGDGGRASTQAPGGEAGPTSCCGGSTPAFACPNLKCRAPPPRHMPLRRFRDADTLRQMAAIAEQYGQQPGSAAAATYVPAFVAAASAANAGGTAGGAGVQAGEEAVAALDAVGDAWWRAVPEEWRRKASNCGAQDFLFTPHADDLKPGAVRYALALELFRRRWAAGEPVIVRGVKVGHNSQEPCNYSGMDSM